MKFDKLLVFFSISMFFYTLSNSVVGLFLPNYYLSIGLSINKIILLNAVIFLLLGIVPLFNLKYFSKYFEKFLIVGMVFNLIFFILLMFVKNPLILGIVDGITFATFFPAFNLMLFRLTDIKQRGFMVMLLYVALPSLTGIIGPIIGGASIHFFSFNFMFILAIILMIVSILFALKIEYKPVSSKIMIPKDKSFWIFAAITIIWGLITVSWLVHPIFLYSLTGEFLNMGIVSSVLAVIFAVVALIVGKISEVQKHRIGFAFLGFILMSVWFFAMAFVKNITQFLLVSVISGLGDVLWLALFSIYGDFFQRKYHATMIVLWETFLMIGRLGNMIPTVFFMNKLDFHGMFFTIGCISLTAIIPFAMIMLLYHKKKIVVDHRQIIN